MYCISTICNSSHINGVHVQRPKSKIKKIVIIITMEINQIYPELEEKRYQLWDTRDTWDTWDTNLTILNNDDSVIESF